MQRLTFASISTVFFLIQGTPGFAAEDQSDPLALSYPEPGDAPLELFRQEAQRTKQESLRQLENRRRQTDSLLAPLASPGAPLLAPLLPATSGAWTAQGPGPTRNGQVENVTPNDEVVGAIHTVVAHPTDPNMLWIGGANGGIWRTTNATAASPTWVPLTDAFTSLSIGAMERDPRDATNQTLVAGIGRFSAFGSAGGPLSGLLRTTDGVNWTPIGQADLTGRNITGVGARGNTIVVSASTRAGGIGPGIYRSTDGGANFDLISGTNGLPAGSVFDLVGDPGNANRFYAGLVAGIFRSDDGGLNWTNITDIAIGAVIGVNTNNIEFAVHNNAGAGTNAVYVGIINNGQLAGFFRSANQGGAWTAMDIPQTNEGGPIVGLQPREKPGSQGATHFSILADANDANMVYVGGDRQPQDAGADGILGNNDDTFPNFIGANDFSGRLFRGDAGIAPTGGVPSPQWEHLTHRNNIAAIPGGGTANNSAPHADSREMVFDANGNIIEVDDGGIYRRTNPANNTGNWFSINGNVQTTEFHDIAYDSASAILIGGAQDTGTHEQNATGSTQWTDIRTADGGDVAVDDTSVAAQSTRFFSTQNLGGFRRRTCNAANVCGANTIIGLNVTSGAALVPQFVTPVELNVTDQTRLIIGGSNSVYESADQGDNIAEINGPGANSNAMAYGHANNAELIVIGSGSGVFVRTIAGGNLVATPAAFPGGTVLDVALDPVDANRFFVIDSNQVFETPDGGTTWNDVTGNLTADEAVNFRTIAYIDQGNADRIVVGTNAGVFFASVLDLENWSELGTGLPHAPVWDLDYDNPDDLLAAGMLGRSAWTVANASQENLAPVAMCKNVTVPTDPGICTANANINDGSFDPDSDPIVLSQVPPGPYNLGVTNVELNVTDDGGLTDSCGANVTVEDLEPPVIQCNAPATITPPDAPISFTSGAQDNCSVATVQITAFDCFKFTKKGKRIDKRDSCRVSFSGNTITIADAGGVDDHISWTVEATDGSGNVSVGNCEVLVVNPGHN